MDNRQKEKYESISLHVYGIVQGVGFRPHAARLADCHGVTGFVKNRGGLVEILASGEHGSLAAFIKELISNPPPNSLIVHYETTVIPTVQFTAFTIEPSEDTQGPVFISPDLAACDDCMREFSTKNDPRYLHPFISCMSCGPRYSIIEDTPYDRETTTMKDFSMCPVCSSEYKNREDRRYHAQTISCHDCGPYLIFSRGNDVTERDEAFECAVSALKDGGVIAVKGVGGYHMVCSPYNQDSVVRLRELKLRESKPFAVMFPDIDAIKEQCTVSAFEEELLKSAARPIVLLEKRDCRLAPAVCNDSRYVGAFLPYTPLQVMLLSACGPLVMTSANISEEPVILDDGQMLAWAGLDGVLYNHRRIAVSLDDSVAKVTGGNVQVIRRARGYAPLPVIMKGFKRTNESVFAAGGDLKSSFCLASGPFAYLSQHIGDLTDEGCEAVYKSSYERMKRIFRIEPELAVCDMHPQYISSDLARSLGLPVLEVQHHHAHIASVMAEHGLEGPVIGLAFDGTGYGADGAVWGGEFLVCRSGGFKRAGHLEYVKFTGGDESMKDASKSAMFHLYSAGLEQYIKDPRWPVLKAAIEKGIGVYQSSSMGRIFDAISAILGVCCYNNYEGECAVSLENLAAEALKLSIEPVPMEYDIRDEGDIFIVDASSILESLVKAPDSDPRGMALGFHRATADMALKICGIIRGNRGINDVVLSGGVFQNSVLLNDLMQKLESEGFSVFINKNVPPNDGGICLGQAYIGLKFMQRKDKTCA